jgi:phospholipid transport system substrate-binding protein
MAVLRSISVATLILLIGAVAVGQTAPVEPMQVIQTSNDAITAVLSEYDPLTAEGETKVYAIMDEVTDFRRMSTAAIDEVCEAEVELCDEWKTVFGDLLRIRSIKGLGRYRADRFDYLNEEINGETAVVNTLAYFEEEEYTLDYELQDVDGQWFIVNYIVDDVDTVRSYRRRFERLLERESVADVIQRLRDRIVEFQQET